MKVIQIWCKYIKFEKRQFSITFSKSLSIYLNAEIEIFEKKNMDFEKSSILDYLACKVKLDNIYNKKVQKVQKVLKKDMLFKTKLKL